MVHLKKDGCIEELEKVNPQQRWSGVKYRGLEKGLDILWDVLWDGLWDVNRHMDGNPGGHAYLCSWGNPPEDSVGISMCAKPLESWEIPHELEGNKSRGTA